MILLAEIFLSVMAGTASPVAPLKHLASRHVDILEELVPTIAAICSWSWDGERTTMTTMTSMARAVREGVGQENRGQA